MLSDQARSELRSLTNVPSQSLLIWPSTSAFKEYFVEKASLPIAQAVTEGAMTEIEAFKLARSKSTAVEIQTLLGAESPGWFSATLPEWLKMAAFRRVSESLSQPYWIGTIDGVREDLQKVLENALDKGWSIARTEREIRLTIGSMKYTKAKATAIARTEITDAMNWGHSLAIKNIGQQNPDLQIGKEWLSIFRNSRDAHMELDGKTVPSDSKFILAGVECSHPGDYVLPASQRINCQCTIISSFVTNKLGIRDV